MPFNLKLSSSQEFSVLSSGFQTPAFQEWEFIPGTPQSILYIPGDPNPSPVPLEIKIEDFSQSHPGYADYLISVEAMGGAPVEPFFDLSGDLDFNQSPMFTVPSDLKANMTIGFNAFGVIAPGQAFILGLKFKAHGKTASGVIQDLNFERDFLFNVAIPAGGQSLLVSPQETFIGHERGAAMPSPKTLSVFASGYWRMKYPNGLDISGGTTYWVDSAGWQNVSGNGDTALQVSLLPEAENTSENMRSYVLPYYNSPQGNQTEGEARVKVLLFDEGDKISANMESFHFFGVKGQSAPGPQLLFVYSLGNISLAENSFLTLSETNGANILMTQIAVPSPENMSTGLHHATISAEGENDTLTIPVTYEVVEMLSLNFSDTRFHFSKEHKELAIYSNAYGESYAEIELEIEQEGKKERYNYNLPIFNNKGVFKLGREIHRLFQKVIYEELFEQSPFSVTGGLQVFTPIKAEKYSGFKNYPNPMDVNVNVKVFERDSGDLVDEDSISCVFLKGHRPKNFMDYHGILSYNNPPQRVTASGQGIINFSGKNTSGKLVVYRNGNQHAQHYYSTAKNRLLSKSLSFSAFTPGDHVKVVVEDNSFLGVSGSELSKEYHVVPQTEQSYHLAWVNECNVIEMMQFIGAFGFSREYKPFESETTDGFIEKIQLLESKKTPSISCNTGFILKDSVSLLDSILSSENCWLVFDGHAPINVVPSTKKLDETDTQNALYAYELTFKINPQNDAEVYSS